MSETREKCDGEVRWTQAIDGHATLQQKWSIESVTVNPVTGAMTVVGATHEWRDVPTASYYTYD